MVLYQRFLTTAPPEVQVNATHIALARCAQELASRPPVVVVNAPAPAAPPPRPRPPRWWRDPWGLALSGVGVAGLAVGLGWFIAADAARDEAGRSTNLAAYQTHWSVAESRRDVALWPPPSVGRRADRRRCALPDRSSPRRARPRGFRSGSAPAWWGARSEAPLALVLRWRSRGALAAGCLGAPSFVCHADGQCGADALLRERTATAARAIRPARRTGGT